MALGFSLALRNARANLINTTVGSLCVITFYDSPRPATGGAITTPLVSLTATGVFAPTTSTGVLTLTGFNTANAVAGTAAWFRIFTSGGTMVMDGTVGTDLVLTNAVFGAGDAVTFTSMTITEGNA